MIWFTADEHYGHENIIKFCHRPFKDTSHMREELIRRNNLVVKDGDIVYHVGDMFWNTQSLEDCLGIMDRLKGDHVYVFGNHEKPMKAYEELRNRFIGVRDVEILHPKDTPSIHLYHFALRVWEQSHRGGYHLYGHTHAALAPYGLSFDCGVDAHSFYPISLTEVHNTMQRRKAILNVTILTCETCGNQYEAIGDHKGAKSCTKCCGKMV